MSADERAADALAQHLRGVPDAGNGERLMIAAIEDDGLRIVDPSTLVVGDNLMASEVAEHLPLDVAERYWAAVIARDLDSRGSR